MFEALLTFPLCIYIYTYYIDVSPDSDFFPQTVFPHYVGVLTGIVKETPWQAARCESSGKHFVTGAAFCGRRNVL